MKKFLQTIKVTQYVSNEKRRKQGLPDLGKGFSEARRLNPYHPLSYILFICLLVVFIPLYGIVGLFDFTNPFKWD